MDQYENTGIKNQNYENKSKKKRETKVFYNNYMYCMRNEGLFCLCLEEFDLKPRST